MLRIGRVVDVHCGGEPVERGSGRGFFDESAATIGAKDGVFDPNPDPDEMVAPVAPVGRGSRSHRSNQNPPPRILRGFVKL